MLNCIKINNVNVGFMHIPKVASTTVKTLMIQASGLNWKDTPAAQWGIHDKDRWIPKNIAGPWWKSITNNDKPDIKFVILREPVERFISGYTNRILYYKKAPHCTFSEFVKLAPAWQNGDIAHHLNPSVNYIGRNPEDYDRIFTMDQVNTEVKAMLEEICGFELPTLERQNGGKDKQKDIVPTEQELAKIKDIYKEDYKYWWNEEVIPWRF